EQEVVNEEVKRQLAKAIAKLSPIYKSVVVQRLLIGSSTQDAALNLGISEEAVKIRLFRAKKQLRIDLLRDSDVDQLYSDSQKYPSVFAGQLA
ncbi:MAG: sigma factor-like helix-turn-helix DNA-binding protein, partial [Bacteroidota bacterium]